MSTVLLAVSSAASPVAQDVALRDDLVANGHTVVYHDAGTALPSSGHDVVVRTESGSSSAAANTSVTTCPLPVVYMETSVGDSTLRFSTTNSSNVESSANLFITTAGQAHSITSGVSNPFPYSSATTTTYGFPDSAAGSGVQILAVNNAAQASVVIAVAESGATLTTGTAPARRVYFGPGIGGSSVSNWTTACFDMFRKAVTWAAPAAPSPVTGSLSAALPKVTGSTSGTVAGPAFTGALSASLPSLSGAIAGTVTPPNFTGALSGTTPQTTGAIAGTVDGPTGSGVLEASLPPVTGSLSGVVGAPAFAATLDASAPLLTADMTGVAVEIIAGTLAATLSAVTGDLVGVVDLTGVVIPDVPNSRTLRIPAESRDRAIPAERRVMEAK